MNPRRRPVLWPVLLALVCACQGEPPGPGPSVAGALSGTPDPGFRRATAPREFRFPRDHGAHPDYQTEWWYFTGHLRSDAGRFGYQLTFFRQALTPQPPQAPGPWASQEVFMGHLALSDIDGGQFHAAERLTRGRPQLAEAAAADLAVTVEDWSANRHGDTVTLRARDRDIALDLTLHLSGPLMLHGDRGLSRKSAEPGNASYYYSMPRLVTRGELEVNGKRHAVSGSSWLDREWSTSVLAENQIGWDWFSLRLDDDSDLMLFQLRSSDGHADRWSAGTLRTGTVQTRLAAEDMTLTPLRRWRSPASAASYPVAWKIEIPSAQLDLQTQPLLDAQELNLAFRYWEGAIEVSGSRAGQPLNGEGYLEMTGYDGEPH